MGAMSLEVKKVGEVLERDVEECRTQIKASQEQHEGGSCVEEQGSMVVVDVEHGGRCDGNDDHDLSKELKTAGWLGTNVYVPPDVAPLLPASLMCSSGKEHPNAIACPPCDADGTLKYENGFNNSNPAFCGGLTSCAVNVRRSDTLLTLPTAGAAADLLQLPQAAPPAHKNPSPTSKFMIPLSSVSPALLPITATTTADLGKSSVYFFSKFAAADNDKPVAKEHAIQPLTDADKLKVIHLSSDPPTVGKSTFFQATLNCLSLLYGLGVLSSPFAVAKTGWMGVVVSVMLSTAYAYAAYLMARCVDFDPACSNYQDIAKLTLGTRMRKLINALFYMELTGTLMGYCISMGDNLDYIFPHVGFGLPGMSNRNFMICIVVLIILPSVWLRDLSALSFTSLWCIISSILLLVAVLLAATVNHIGFKHPIPLLHIKGVPVAAGLYAFSYGGTSVFPSIYKSMKEPRRFPQVWGWQGPICSASIRPPR
ncbi:hypothetical protein KP509_04G003800 [Ceratopteris richardii]|uniref:Amino acid transporter transmembrane domain-containing protein n=1 Tax=Ceratopteris richardii TaxID=49495 RepID=A0A8T2UPR0_CERRI|nr:hypothetical protein KP509_04G003800 [Ceratopteris richardii]